MHPHRFQPLCIAVYLRTVQRTCGGFGKFPAPRFKQLKKCALNQKVERMQRRPIQPFARFMNFPRSIIHIFSTAEST